MSDDLDETIGSLREELIFLRVGKVDQCIATTQASVELLCPMSEARRLAIPPGNRLVELIGEALVVDGVITQGELL